jgi:hypothetical protein
MGAFLAWVTALVLVLAAVLAVYHLGLDLTSSIGSWMHSIERALARPL